MSRAAIAILSTENLHHNLSILRQASPNRRVIAMIKANAYGHGLRSVAQRLEKHVDSLGVASINEADALRKIGIKGSITLIEGVYEPDELLIASSQKFHVVFHDKTQIDWLEKSYLPLPLSAWIKVDTGMGRLGFDLNDGEIAYERLKANPQLQQPVGIMSHLACADDKDHSLNQRQLDRFRTFVAGKPGFKSLANSPAMLQFPDAHFDTVRPGLALYGVSPIQGKTAADLGLKPVMTLRTRLIAVRQMKKGSTIGYGCQFTCSDDMPMGVVAMGYGDGYPRTAGTGTPVLVNGERCQLVGRVSMDMLTIDLRSCPNAKPGDPVTLWGVGLPIEEVAVHTAHVPYDLLCGIQPRVIFHWTLNS